MAIAVSPTLLATVMRTMREAPSVSKPAAFAAHFGTLAPQRLGWNALSPRIRISDYTGSAGFRSKIERSTTLETSRSTRAVMDAMSPSSGSASSTSGSKSSAYNVESSIRPELRDMAPYVPIHPHEVLAQRLGRRPEDIVKLDANENPYGPAPSVHTALAKAPYLHIYPDPMSSTLRKALSEYTQVPDEFLLAGAGADELIDLLCRLFITPGQNDSILNCPPTFGMYKFDADVNGATIVNVPRRDDFSVNIDAIERIFADSDNPPKLIFLASPNNPDGSVLTDDEVHRLLELPTLLVLDEAYCEFASTDHITWVPQYSNLVVLRTFSKWAALAGMRIGYGAFPLEIIKHLWKIKQPYNVSVAAQVAAVASLNDKHDLLAKVARMVAARDEFFHRASRFDWLYPYPSQSNYVLCRVAGGRDANQVRQALADRGILIRYYTSPGLSDCIRISMGTERDMERVYEALADL